MTEAASRISNDQIWGGEGNDFLYGQHRDDTVQGNAGSDLVFGGDTGLDVLAGGPQVNPGDVDDVAPGATIRRNCSS